MDRNSSFTQVKNSAGIEQYLQKLLIEAYKENQAHVPDEVVRTLVDEDEEGLLYYLKNMQHAIMPYSGKIPELFLQSFIFSAPKENISGDFYWVEQFEDKIYVAVADCKVHGVNGAMMSLICASTLNRVFHEFNIYDTGKILDKTKCLLTEIFKDSESDKQFEISMSLCCINKTTCVLEWSGANNNLFYVHNGIIEEMKGDKQTIRYSEDSMLFTKHKMYLSKGDMIYLFTDGFTNQIGGEQNEKMKYKSFQETLIRIAPLRILGQKDILEKKFELWKGEQEQTDDLLIIGIRL